ncbi:hypothetical protein EST38_g13145 [Candolleomyces aberdarensis]|uniref:DUF6535 domain-containing protein n=1 Tax=Candolleomyces aberdarensis TaxID=2316362 RepID=A0A4Q2D0J9_9AGAR|nr:hypothetical protein EST38_g13145 [Candolleomyces aberdarensis]
MSESPNGDDKPWECGGSYKRPLPKPEEDPWTKLLQPLQQKDQARCNSWKEEVQNILIFAGLFSAVVTAFIVESQKTLRTDPIEAILPLLLAKMTDGQLSQASKDVFSLSEDASIRINTLWLLSLVFSLVTVLIGIVSLQWLREHQRPYGNLEPQVAFSLHQMQAEALDKWWVPQIFTMLPLLLQVALVLFLVGLNELLFNLNRTVAIWVAVAIWLTLLFLVATTILPTLQNLLLFLPWTPGQKPRSPCPYKSPQAWAFHHLLSSLVHGIMKVFKTPFESSLKIDPENLTSEDGRADWWEPMPRGTRILFRDKRKDTWLEHCVAWLFQRDLDYMKLHCRREGAAQTFSKRPIPIYDAIQGILEVKHGAFSHTNFTSVDHCIASVVAANDMGKGKDKPYAQFLHHLSLAEPLIFGLPPGTSPVDPQVLHEDSTLRLFSRDTSVNNFPYEAVERCVEICLRLTAWMYGGKEVRPCNATRDHESMNHTTPKSLPIQWVTHVLDNHPLDQQYLQEIQRQTRMVILRFFERAKTWDHAQIDREKTFDGNEYLGRFLSSAAKIVTRGGDYSICDDILNCIHTNPANSDYAYQAAYVFCHAILAYAERGKKTSRSLRLFVRALYNYQRSIDSQGTTSPVGLMRPLIPHTYYDWKKFLGGALSLGVELDTNDNVRDTIISYVSSNDVTEEPKDCVLDILPQNDSLLTL